MATLYVTFKSDEDAMQGDAHEKMVIGATDLVSAALAKSTTGIVELYTDTVCLVSIAAAPSTAVGGVYIGPGIKYRLGCGKGAKVAVKAA